VRWVLGVGVEDAELDNWWWIDRSAVSYDKSVRNDSEGSFSMKLPFPPIPHLEMGHNCQLVSHSIEGLSAV
jgi:hypothetical protein